jgi:hypothetical protein
MSDRPGTVARQLFEAYGRGDLPAVGSLVADHLVAYVTSPGGDVDLVEGVDLPAFSAEFWS